MEMKWWATLPLYLGSPSEHSSCTACTWGPVWCCPSWSGSRRHRRWCSCSCTLRTGERSPGLEEVPLLLVASLQQVPLEPCLLLPSRSWRRSPIYSWTCPSLSHWVRQGCQWGQRISEVCSYLAPPDGTAIRLSPCCFSELSYKCFWSKKGRSWMVCLTHYFFFMKRKHSSSYLRLNSWESDLITSEVVSEY